MDATYVIMLAYVVNGITKQLLIGIWVNYDLVDFQAVIFKAKRILSCPATYSIQYNSIKSFLSHWIIGQKYPKNALAPSKIIQKDSFKVI